MVYVLLADGFETIEALAPVDVLRRAGIEVKTVGVNSREVVSGQGICVAADIPFEEIDESGLEMLVLPGGAGVDVLANSEKVIELVKTAAQHEKLLAAICAAPSILAKLGLLDGKHAVCYPSYQEMLQSFGAKIITDASATHDRNIITAAAAGDSIEFGLKLVAMIKGWTHSETVRKAIHYHDAARPLS